MGDVVAALGAHRALTVVMVSADSALVEWVDSALATTGHRLLVLDDVPLASTSHLADADVVLVDVSANGDHGLARVRSIVTNLRRSGTPVLAIGPDQSAAQIHAALHAGASDFIVARASSGDTLVERVVTWAERRRAPSPGMGHQLAEVVATVAAASGTDAALAAAAAGARRMANAQQVAIYALDGPGATLVAYAGAGPQPAPERQTDLLAAVRRAGSAIIVDIEASPGLTEVLLPSEAPAGTVGAFPVQVSGDTVGVLVVRTARSGSLDAATVADLGVLAQILAVHISGSREAPGTDTRVTLDDVFDRVGDGLLLVGRRGEILRANRRIARLLGYQTRDVAGRNVMEFVVSDDRASIMSLVQRMQSGRVRRQTFAVRLLDRDGQTRTFEASVEPIQDPAGAAIVALHDVTAAVALTLELRRTKTQIENILRASPDVIIAIDADGKVVLLNPSAADLIGIGSNTPLGNLTLHDLFPDGESYRILQRLREPRTDGTTGTLRNHRCWLKPIHGGRASVIANAATVHGEDGAPTGYVLIVTDLRQIESIERELAEARKQVIQSEREAAIAALAGATAHHLNQPLTAVLGYVQILRRRHPGVADDPAVVQIERAAERMAEIVREVGRLTRYETRRYAGRESILDIPQGEDSE